MPTLDWLGKQAVINHHRNVPYRTLDLQYTYGAESSENKIIHGDNLEALKALLPEYEGAIKCIYIDPPYNTGNEQWVYNDNVNSPRIQKWLGQVVGKESEDFSRHDKWLCMMYPRLTLLQQLLSDDGVIFISIDDNELASLKLVCDEIFGHSNFIGQWHWYRSATPPNLSYKIKKNLEYIIAYEKQKNSNRYKGVRKFSASDDPITKPQNTLKVLTFPVGSINFKGVKSQTFEQGVYGTTKFPNKLLNDLIVEDYKNVNEVSFENRFIWTQDKLNYELQNKTTINSSKRLVISYKKNNYDPEVPPNLIDESVNVETTEESGKLLAKIFGNDKIFEFPKPPSLVEYLINFLCDKDSIILDSFAGSGTTAHAVLNMNKNDGGNRKFILVEMEDYAKTITAERVHRVIDGYGEGKNAVVGTGGSFSYYELGEPVMIGEYINEDQPIEKIQSYIWYTETHSAYKLRKEKYYLGKLNNVGYYFYYEKDCITTLSYDTLKIVCEKAEQYIIYADQCLIDKNDLLSKNIVFKKIPRDIRKF